MVYILEQNKGRLANIKKMKNICIRYGIDKKFVIGGYVTLKIFFERSNVSPCHHNLVDYMVKYLTTSLHYYIKLSSHIDSLKQNSTPIEFQNWNPIVDGSKGNCKLCYCIQVLHFCSRTSFDMDGQETCIFCGSSEDPHLFLQLQWVSNIFLSCLGGG